jgi:outer membrane protein assembly factor BamB
VTSIAVAPLGDIYLAGTYTGSPDFGPGALPGTSSSQLFLAKFDPQGIPVWAQAFTGAQADVKINDAGIPVLAATTIKEVRSGGSGTLHQLDPSNGPVLWEYAYAWPAGKYAEHIAIESGKSTVLAIPGHLVSLDGKGQVLWDTAITASGEGYPGFPVELVESTNGDLTLFMVDYMTSSPITYQYRLTAFDAQGKQRWTRRLNSNINQPIEMAGETTGKSAIFGTAYGKPESRDKRTLWDCRSRPIPVFFASLGVWTD